MEIPEYIRFDFLLVIIGVASFYLAQMNKELAPFILLAGAVLFVIGIGFVKYNYDLDMEIKELDYAKKKTEYS
ncbi:hypothetical protein HZC31_05965 [Candidatus Woesearchaeota archaeon]|nr:hypothetical protein [Candidatus Woesearchaeota archaeon]